MQKSFDLKTTGTELNGQHVHLGYTEQSELGYVVINLTFELSKGILAVGLLFSD